MPVALPERLHSARASSFRAVLSRRIPPGASERLRRESAALRLATVHPGHGGPSPVTAPGRAASGVALPGALPSG